MSFQSLFGYWKKGGERKFYKSTYHWAGARWIILGGPEIRLGKAHQAVVEKMGTGPWLTNKDDGSPLGGGSRHRGEVRSMQGKSLVLFRSKKGWFVQGRELPALVASVREKTREVQTHKTTFSRLSG